MASKILQLLLFFYLLILNSFAQTNESKTEKRKPTYHYSFPEREHTSAETLRHIGAVYLLSWGAYYLSQPETFEHKGSFKNYRHHFGRVVFDKDEPFWNWLIHPLSGSQLYLYYRANGYQKIDSLKLAFVSSTLFEFLVEIYTEPASFQDLYQTPLLGSSLGLIFENLSFYLLNTGVPFLKVLGHVINPMTLFWFYEGKVTITPQISKKQTGLNLRIPF